MAEPAAAEVPEVLPIGPGLRLRRFDPDRAAPAPRCAEGESAGR